MQDLKVGDKYICIVNNHEFIAPCEIVEVEEVLIGGLFIPKGYTREVDIMLFRKY